MLVDTYFGPMGAEQNGNGQDVLLLHSLLTDRRVYDRILPTLVEQRRVTLIDLPGYGDSVTVEPHMDDLADAVGATIEELDLSPDLVIVGNGLGSLDSWPVDWSSMRWKTPTKCETIRRETGDESVRTMADDEMRTPEERARKRTKDLMGLLWHLATYVIVNGFLWTLDIMQGNGVDWAMWVTIPWGIGLLFHLAAYFIDDSRLEDRIYKRFLAKEQEGEQ